MRNRRNHSVYFYRTDIQMNGYERYTATTSLTPALAEEILNSIYTEMVQSADQVPLEVILLGPQLDIMAISNNHFIQDKITYHRVR